MRLRKWKFIGALLLFEVLAVFVIGKFVLTDQNSLLEVDGRVSRHVLFQTECAVMLQQNHNKIIQDKRNLRKLLWEIEKIDVERNITIREKGKEEKADHVIELKDCKNKSTFIMFDHDFKKVWIDFQGRSGYIYHIKDSHEIKKYVSSKEEKS